MTEPRHHEVDEGGAVEVVVYRDGTVIHRELCESEDEAAMIVATWDEMPGVRCVVSDLSEAERGPEDLEVDEAWGDDEYPAGRDEG
jgi:hypothetical protein